MEFFNALFPGINPVFLLIALLWSTFWKILALWRAVKGGQRFWFVIIFIINTLGVLEIVYLLHFAKKKLTFDDIKQRKFLP